MSWRWDLDELHDADVNLVSWNHFRHNFAAAQSYVDLQLSVVALQCMTPSFFYQMKYFCLIG